MAMKSNEIFKQMLDWVYANTEVHNQAEIARRTGVNEVTISRVLNGKIQKVKQETIRKVNIAFGSVFNPAWLRGDSDIMLIDDIRKQPDESRAATHVGSHDDAPDMNSLINTALSAKDETIMSLRRELEAKDAAVCFLNEQLKDRTDIMQSIRQHAEKITSKYESLLQEHQPFLHHTTVNIATIHDSNLSIAAEPTAFPYGKPEK